MIKQTWNIDLEERRRILELHESATQRLYLLNEQAPVQGPGSPNVVLDQDENFVYFLSQPSFSVGANYIDWSKDYFVYASDGETSYQCEITEKDKKGRPMKVQVLKDKPLVNMDRGEFLFNMIKQGRKDFDYNYGNEMTKNSFLFIRKEESGMPTRERYFGVVYNAKPVTVVITNEGPSSAWGYSQNNNFIDFDELEVGSSTLFDPRKDAFRSKKLGYFSLVIPTLVTSYPVSIGKTQPEKPTEIPGKVPTPPQPVPLGDKFMDNISMPTVDAILKDPKFIEFKKFVEGNDMSKFVFDIQSSASKCSAGYKESNKANGKWSEDKSTYPDVTVDPQADKNDVGNLNLTKARAQNLKNFLITNLPKLKDAKFRVIAQGSKGTCGTEEDNQKLRRVDLTVTQL